MIPQLARFYLGLGLPTSWNVVECYTNYNLSTVIFCYRLRSLIRESAYATQEHNLELQMEKDNFRQLLRETTQENEQLLQQKEDEITARDDKIHQLEEQIR